MVDVQAKQISVIGAARSGVAVAKLLNAHGAEVFVSDGAPAEKLQDHLEVLRVEGIRFETGGHSDRVYESTLMVISPGVPSDAKVVVQAGRCGIPVVSELEAASWFCRAPIIAITGSNGKTTTTTLAGRVLGDTRRRIDMGGNIGRAFSLFAGDLNESDTAVLEVSSFQLDHCEQFRPSVAAILNITPDHMDRYGHSMERYAASKARIFKNQTVSDVLIYGADDEWTVRAVQQARSRKIGFGLQRKSDEGAFVENGRMVTVVGGTKAEIIEISQISIRGVHNLYNAMAATLIGLVSGVGPASIRATLRNFKGVEHRLEFVRELNGVRYFNDSKATNVDSVWYALEAFTEPIVLLLGGRDKGNDYSRLMDPVKHHVRSIVAIGESAEKVEQAFGAVVPVTRSDSIDEAVATAKTLARSGDVVLLSPACASFDWFRNYEQRGQVFKQLVHSLE